MDLCQGRKTAVPTLVTFDIAYVPTETQFKRFNFSVHKTSSTVK